MQLLRKLIIWGIALTLNVFLLTGCGGGSPEVQTNTQTAGENNSQKEDMSDIEALLGIEASKTQDKTKPKEKDDELLTLLGANEKPKEVNTKSTSTQNSEPSSTFAATPPPTKSSNDQLRKKDAEIQRLKNEIKDKDMKIQRLESAPAYAATATVLPSDISDEEYKGLYEQGLELFNNRQYNDAITVFKRLISSNDGNSLSDNAQYWIGESNYMMGKYKTAIMDFEKVFTYSNSNKLDYAQFKLGKCYERLGDKQRAKDEFERFLDQYPKSSLSSNAKKEIQKLQ